MTKVDQGFLINKFKYNENSIIADFYTKESGKLLGLYLVERQKRLKAISRLVIIFI